MAAAALTYPNRGLPNHGRYLRLREWRMTHRGQRAAALTLPGGPGRGREHKSAADTSSGWIMGRGRERIDRKLKPCARNRVPRRTRDLSRSLHRRHHSFVAPFSRQSSSGGNCIMALADNPRSLNFGATTTSSTIADGVSDGTEVVQWRSNAKLPDHFAVALVA